MPHIWFLGATKGDRTIGLYAYNGKNKELKKEERVPASRGAYDPPSEVIVIFTFDPYSNALCEMAASAAVTNFVRIHQMPPIAIMEILLQTCYEVGFENGQSSMTGLATEVARFGRLSSEEAKRTARPARVAAAR